MTVDLNKLIDVVAARVGAHAQELTELDSAIGDADHGLNMKRGFDAVLADKAQIAEKPLPEALRAIGMALVMKVGGASGPLYGTLFMTLGKELPPEPGLPELARAMKASVEALKQRGKADFGNKTMLDVLGPISERLSQAPVSFDDLRATAKEAAAKTVPMKAIRGRASFLGDRSIGHMDPGARSSELILEAVCDALEGKS